MNQYGPDIQYSQEDNLYYASYGPLNTPAQRSYPVPTPLTESCPLVWKDFLQLPFTFGEALGIEPEGTFQMWDLEGNEYSVVREGDLLKQNGEPLQKQGVTPIVYPKGYTGEVDLDVPNGRLLIGSTKYTFTDKHLDRPVDELIPSGTPYLSMAKVFCYTQVNTGDLDLPFPGSNWSIKPLSSHDVHCIGAYADLYNNSWYVPIPFPKRTFVKPEEDGGDPVANGFDMPMELPKISYNRYTNYWAGTFPMAHSINSPLERGIVRSLPLIVKLKQNYRMHYRDRT